MGSAAEHKPAQGIIMDPVYRLRGLVKIRKEADAQFRLQVPELTIHRGEKLALVGTSGCGKSTLLDILAMALSPSQAEVFDFTTKSGRTVDVAAIWARRKLNRLSELRKRHVGYVLQTGGLLPYVSVRDNIGLAGKLLPRSDKGMVDELAKELGLTRHLNKLPASLSVGERQRVAIARALAHRPSIVIADEPTASLDPLTAAKTMAVFVRLTDELGLTLIVATHDSTFIKAMGFRRLNQHYRQVDTATVSQFME